MTIVMTLAERKLLQPEPVMAVSIDDRLNHHSSTQHDPITVYAVRLELGISRERMARLLDVSSRTVTRWEDQHHLPSNRWVLQVLIQVRNIAEVGRESLTSQGFRAFMTTPQPAFGNRSGIEMIERGEAEAVYRELAGMAEGYTGT